MEDKMVAETFGTLGIMGETAPTRHGTLLKHYYYILNL